VTLLWLRWANLLNGRNNFVCKADEWNVAGWRYGLLANQLGGVSEHIRLPHTEKTRGLIDENSLIVVSSLRYI
jgi:hypothetical protein